MKKQNKEIEKELRLLMHAGKPYDELLTYLLSKGLESTEAESKITRTYKTLFIEHKDDFSSRKRFYVYILLWVAGWWMLVIYALARFLGDAFEYVLFGGIIVLVLLGIYMRFKNYPKYIGLLHANNENNYEKK